MCFLYLIRFQSTQLKLKGLRDALTTSQDWSVTRRGNAWNESRDDVNYDLMKMLHEDVTFMRYYDVFTTSSQNF